jgi:putative flippase GtrA
VRADVIRFCFVGGLVFAIDYACIWAFKKALPPLGAVCLAYVIAVSVHYLLNKLWVFPAAGRADSFGDVPRYVTTVVICWICTVSLVAFGLRFISPNIYLAKALAIPPTTLLGYLLMKRWVFR